MQPIHIIALNLIEQIKRISVTENKSLIKSEQRLRLFSSWRQPPLLVIRVRGEVKVRNELVDGIRVRVRASVRAR